nr:MAG: RNA-dependent RNA polymerase [Grapevine umbra-like virus 3]
MWREAFSFLVVTFIFGWEVSVVVGGLLWIWGKVREWRIPSQMSEWLEWSQDVSGEDLKTLSSSQDWVRGRRPWSWRRRSGGARGKAQRTLAVQLRAKFGLMLDNPANRHILEREARLQAELFGVRKVDMMFVVPMAVELALTPTWADEEAAVYRKDRAVASRKADYGPGFLVPRAAVVLGEDTKIHHKLPKGVVRKPPRGSWKDPVRRYLVVEIPRPPERFAIHNNSGINLLRALVERVYLVQGPNGLQPPPQPVNLGAKLRDVFIRLTSYCSVVPVLSRDELIACYAGDRRRTTRYCNARDSLEVSPLRAVDARLEAFVKCEKINFSKKIDPAPRIIQPRKPRFLMETGRYFRPLEHVMYRRLGKLYGHPCVAKGFNAVDTARLIREKWDMFDDPCCISLDASRFDQHVSVPALEWTHAVYKAWFPNDPYFSWLLSLMIHNEGVALAKDCSFKYAVEGRRMSGDMDTALGNCLLMVAMVWTYGKNLWLRHQVMDNGDDIIVFMEASEAKRFLKGIPEFFGGLGFKMTVEPPVFEFEHIEFCQTKPCWNGQEWVMCRGIPALSKDLVCTIGVESLHCWLHEVGNCGLALCQGVPVLQEAYTWMRKQGGSSNARGHAGFASGMQRMAIGLVPKWREVTGDARVSFWKMTGILPDHQMALEAMYRELGEVSGIYNKGQTKDELHDVCDANIWQGGTTCW